MNFRFVLHYIFMAVPFFYSEEIMTGTKHFVLEEDTSKHIVQVLRMQQGEALSLTDGNGNLYHASIADDNRKRCVVDINGETHTGRPPVSVTIAISLLKNTSRFEWFLEKATELGVTQIIPLICERTEKQHARMDRMKGILVSAMLQSQQCWLPVLSEPAKFNELLKKDTPGVKLIAHCEDDASKNQLADVLVTNKGNKIILVGPEGDFSQKEINLALSRQYIPVALGNTRLRTETAGIVAATLMCQC